MDMFLHRGVGAWKGSSRPVMQAGLSHITPGTPASRAQLTYIGEGIQLSANSSGRKGKRKKGNCQLKKWEMGAIKIIARLKVLAALAYQT